MENTELKDLTIEQLQQVLKLLDKVKNPQQAKEISDLLYAKIHAKNLAEQTKSESFSHFLKTPFRKSLKPWSHLVTAGLLFSLALYIHFSNKIPFLNIPLELDGIEFTKLALVLSCAGSGALSVFHFFQEYFAQKKKNSIKD